MQGREDHGKSLAAAFFHKADDFSPFSVELSEQQGVLENVLKTGSEAAVEQMVHLCNSPFFVGIALSRLLLFEELRAHSCGR